MIFVDSVLIVSVLLASLSLSLQTAPNYWYWPNEEMFWIVYGAPFIAIPVFFSFRMYHSITRYLGTRTAWSIAQAVTLYAVVWGLFSLMSNHPLIMNLLGITSDPFSSNGSYFEGISRSAIFINWMLVLIIIGCSRLLARWLLNDNNWLFNHNNLYTINRKNKVIIYGAGSAGRQLADILRSSKDYQPIAYIDDDLVKIGAYVNNIPVFSNNKIEKLIEKNNVSEVLLALPSLSRKKRNEIIDNLSPFSVQVRSLPSVSELAEGKVRINDLLEIDIRDLLGRELVQPNKNLLKIKITDKVVLVTGAGGSIGSELCRQILLLKPKKLILFEVSESSLYQIQQELKDLNTINVEIFSVLGSVRDYMRMKEVFSYYEVQTIYHAAAYKHVPLVEYNSSQGVLNNAIGTMITAKVAIAENVETFVLISTDKAVRPSSTMGAAKRVAELVLQALAKQPNNTCLTMVRFGNVLDSSGSVIPLFKKQIRDGGPITVTDANMVRYFMTIPEAVELVIQAGAMGNGGDIFVLDMGKPMKIYELARKMVQLSGLQVLDDDNPDGDIEIQYTGLRPGEKLYEELLVGDNVTETECKLIMCANEKMIEWDFLEPMLKELEDASLNSKPEKIRKLLKQIVPQFSPQSDIVDLVYDKKNSL
jgi:FlaA1/EpsC-like NDP-sugar epimerase